jgi:hypothetical protein
MHGWNVAARLERSGSQAHVSKRLQASSLSSNYDAASWQSVRVANLEIAAHSPLNDTIETAGVPHPEVLEGPLASRPCLIDPSNSAKVRPVSPAAISPKPSR